MIRRCASVSETGVTNVCNWGVDEAGIYYEECYCTSEGCNHGTKGMTAPSAALLLLLAALLSLQ